MDIKKKIWFLSGGFTPIAEYQAILDRATTLGYTKPSIVQQILDNALIITLKASGDWAKLDVFYWFATDGSRQFASLNWKNPSLYQMVEISSVTFTTSFGFQSGGAAAALNWTFAPSNGVLFQRNDSCFGIYNNIGYGIADTEMMVGTQNVDYIGGINGPLYTAIQDGGSNTGLSAANTINAGSTYAAVRTGANAAQLYVNGSSVFSYSTASSAPDSHTFYSLAENINDSVFYAMNAIFQIAGQFAGNSGVSQSNIHNAMRARALANYTLGTHFASVTQTKITLTGTTINVYGDSITSGLNASIAGNRWANLLAAAKSLTLTNGGLSGSGAWYAMTQIKGLTFDVTKFFTVMAGFNDIDRNGSAARTLKKIEACYRSIMIAAIRGAQVASGSASVSRTGTITTSLATTYGGVNSNFAIPNAQAASQSSTSGDNWQWTFSGTGFCLQFIASDGAVATYGTVDIYIDGVVVKSVDLNVWYDGVSDGVYDNKRGPLAYSFHGLSNGSHTIKVQLTSSNTVILDFFAPLNTVASCPPMLFAEIPYRQGSTYPLSARDSGSDVIKAIVDEYLALGYNIAFVKTNTYYNIYSGLSYDNVHPYDAGHVQIDNAFLAAIN